MTSRGGRDRFRRDYSSRSGEKSHHGRSNVPPSRHLWVGNLSHNLSENALANLFLQFGDLESVAFQPGRSYAFINFKHDEEAFAAVGALQGFNVAGSPLKIEFAKADKSSAPSYDEDYSQRRDEQRSGARGSPFSPRDSRTYDPSLDLSYPDKPKMSDRNSEAPSEVLWIGFPALLKVDEVILRKAFSPFGEIEKITAFPGRSYAFVRFKNVMAACRAKETLQGKLFGNPRVHICFARSESGPSNSGRNSKNSPPSPIRKSYGRAGSSDRNYGSILGDPTMRSPRFISNHESRDRDVLGFRQKGNLWMDEGDEFEQRRFQELGSDLGLPENMYERHRSPKRDRGAPFHDLPQKGPFYDDSWDLPEEALLFHGAKKLKTDSFPPDNELPEYPFSGPEQAKHGFPRKFPDYPQHEPLDKNFEPGPFGYKQIADRAMNLKQQYGERSDHWNAPYDGFQGGSGSLPPNPVEWKRSTPESRHPSLTEEWKWKGTIAKGGTPVCQARCFPVGKVLDMPLPEFLDCTARTGLDMLAKHYYQAANSWVVFFVPGSDADIGYYNEFMNYLGEKQRAAVSKLDETTTLFLVPPSEFSEKVLKVPGKLSISGVVLTLEHPGPNPGSSLPHPQDKKETNFMSYRGDGSYPKQTSPPPGHFPSAHSFPNMRNSGVMNLPFPGDMSTSSQGIGSMSNSSNENRNDMVHQRFGQNWSPHHLQNPNSGPRNMASQSNTAFDPPVQGYNPAMPRDVHETSSSSYTPRMTGMPFGGSSKLSRQETKPQVSSSTPGSGIQPEQLVQLASSLLGPPRQSSGGPSLTMGEDFRQSGTMNHSENSYGTPQRYTPQNNQFGQVQPLPLPPPPPLPQQQQQQQQQASHVAVSNQQMQSGGTQDEDADPQKRLQATLQLAAALLQQIQQGKGN